MIHLLARFTYWKHILGLKNKTKKEVKDVKMHYLFLFLLHMSPENISTENISALTHLGCVQLHFKDSALMKHITQSPQENFKPETSMIPQNILQWTHFLEI